jgi:hypothetical protein
MRTTSKVGCHTLLYNELKKTNRNFYIYLERRPLYPHHPERQQHAYKNDTYIGTGGWGGGRNTKQYMGGVMLREKKNWGGEVEGMGKHPPTVTNDSCFG